MSTANVDSKTIVIIGTLVASGNRRVISVGKDYHEALDALPSKRLLLKILPLP